MTSTEASAHELSFEALMREVDRLTGLLEKGELPLEEALAAFERGMALSRQAGEILARAESRLVRLMEGERGQVEEVEIELPGDPAA
jgi:exodeoxyribonuclease VII small subunit